MIKSIYLLLLAASLQAGLAPGSWPGSMIMHLKPGPTMTRIKHAVSKRPRPKLIERISPKVTGHDAIQQVPPKGLSSLSANPYPYKILPSADDIVSRADYEFAMKVKKTGEIAKEARILQRVVDQYPETIFCYKATLELADIDFRLGQDNAAYDLLSAYDARYRTKWVPGHGGDAIRLTNTDFLLLTSLAVAKQGQVFAGQGDYLRNFLDPSGKLRSDLPSSNSVHDVKLLSYLAVGDYWDEWHGNGNGLAGFWYFSQAYREFGPTAPLDLAMAGCAWSQKNPTLAFQYLDDGEARCNSVLLYSEIESARRQFTQEIRDAKNKAQH